MQQVFTEKMNRLEAKVIQLETKVQQQEALLEKFQKEKATDNSFVSSKSQPTSKGSILRTCHEIRSSDPSLASGMYWIDPDGLGVGDDPINVYCNMSSGNTKNYNVRKKTVYI